MSSKPRLLLIDECAEDRALARLVLSAAIPGAMFDEAGDSQAFLDALDSGYFDLVVTEFATGWAHGPFLLQAVSTAQPRAPIVVFTRTDDRASAVAALKAGAVDFVVKSSAGFLDLRRAAGEALPEMTAALDSGALRERDSASVEVAPKEPSPEAAAPEDEPESRSEVGARIEAEKAPVPDPEREPLPGWRSAGPSSPKETFRSAMESARQSISTASHRPMGAVLGIIAILAAFIVLYATFFGGDSDAVEAGARPAVTVPVAAREVAPRPAEPVRDEPRVTMTEPEPAPPPVLDAAPLRLDLRAESEVWIQVTVDGEQVLDAVLKPGQTRTFEGRRMAALLIGNAAGLSVSWNGEDLGSLGRQGQVRRMYFSPTEVGVGPPPS